VEVRQTYTAFKTIIKLEMATVHLSKEEFKGKGIQTEVKTTQLILSPR
jgi:hypothetical protein